MQGVSVLSGGILEPFKDLVSKDIPDLFVWNGKDILTLFGGASLCQVAGCKQQAPDIINGRIYLWTGV